MNFVPAEDIEPFKDSAITIMKNIDLDDSPFLALAMMLNAPIWSNDRHFKEAKNRYSLHHERDLTVT